ncbi:MAG: ABC transporter permease [Thermodesulfobacteriota bacterium]
MTPVPAWALVKKELLSKLRTRWLSVVIAGFVLGGVLMVWNAWPVPLMLLPGYWLPAILAKVSTRLTVAVYGVLMAVCALVIPAIAAGSISLERKTETLDQLRLTLITHLGIVTGKLLGVIGIFLVVVFAMLPVCACVLFLPGVDSVQLVWSFVTVAVCACSCAAVGIMCSAFFKGSVAATVASYVVTLLVPLGSAQVLIGLAMKEWAGYGPNPFSDPDTLRVFCPLIPLLDSRLLSGGQLPHALAYQVLIIAVCFGFTVLRLREESKSRYVRSSEKPASAEVLEQRRRSFPYFLIDPKAPRHPIPDHRNPMLVKELRWGILSRASSTIRLFYVSLFVCTGICAWELVNPSWGRGYAYGSSASDISAGIFIEIALVLCITPVMLARAFSKEDEHGNMDMLRMTLLTPWQIVWGKLLSGLIAISPAVLGAMVATCLVSAVVLLEPGVARSVFGALVTLVVLVLLSLSVGLFSSLVTRKTGLSIILSYGLSAIVIVGVAEAILVLLPFDPHLSTEAWWASLMDFAGPARPEDSGLLGVFLYLSRVWYRDPALVSLVVTTWVLAMLAYLAATFGAIAASIYYFRAHRMQD